MKKLLIAGITVALGYSTVGDSKADEVDTVINFSGHTVLYPGINDLSLASVVTLGPGTYEFTPVKNPFPGAIYDGAYSFGNGQWSGGYNIAINDINHVSSYYSSDFPFDASTAFAEAFGGSFTLGTTSNVYFGVGDNPSQYSDNGGGISLHLTGGIAPVPEPETYALLLAGLGLLGFHARRRKLKEVAAA